MRSAGPTTRPSVGSVTAETKLSTPTCISGPPGVRGSPRRVARSSAGDEQDDEQDGVDGDDDREQRADGVGRGGGERRR